MAWHEATVKTQAEIVTLELDDEMIRASRRTIDHFKLGDRVSLIEGPAAESIPTLSGQFDLIFVDANKDGYEGYVKQILDLELLAPRGLILCDNGNAPNFLFYFTLILSAYFYCPLKDFETKIEFCLLVSKLKGKGRNRAHDI